jgi:SIS domain
MSEPTVILKNAVAAAKETLQSLLDLDSQVAKAADVIEQCLRAGNKLLICGNGGSAADASHFATEFVVRFTKDRPAYPAICLAGDGGLLTAAGNDYGFDEIFARQVAAFGILSAHYGKQKRISSRLLLSWVVTAGQLSVWPTSTSWFAAIPQPGSRKRISFCCTSCARSRKRACQETSCRGAACRLRFERSSSRHPPEAAHYKITRIFLEGARVRDQVAGVRSLSNYQFQISKFCLGLDQSRCKRHPGPPNGWNAFWGRHGTLAGERSAFSLRPTREVPARRRAFQ